MNSRRSFVRRDIGQIQNKVANLPEEHIGRRPALVPVILILIAIDETHSFERGGSLDNRARIRVANQLGEIVVDNRPGDDIGAFGEIHNRGCRTGRSTAFWRKTTAIADSSVDCFGIVRLAIACLGQRILHR